MNSLPGFLTRNLRLKVGCALLAVVTWTGVVYAGNPPQTRNLFVPVPQALASIPTGFKLIKPVPNIQVRLGGTRDSLGSFDTSSLGITVNWKSVKHAGVQSIPIGVVNNNPKVELLDAPTSVQADIDVLTSVSVPVTIIISATPPPGILLGAQSASPSAVAVSGPQQELNGVQVHATIDLSAQRANFQAPVFVYAYDSHGNKLGDLELIPNVVTVSINLSSSITSRVVAVKPNIVGKVSTGYFLSGIAYSPLTITLSGPQDLLNAIDSVNTSTISINGLTGNVTVTVPVQVNTAGVTASSGLITVTIQVSPLATPTPAPTPPPSPSPT